MAVHAHPDDESSKGAATMARYVARGRGRARGDLHRRGAGLDPQPGDGPPGDRRQHRRGPRGARWRMPARSSASRRSGSASSTRGCPRATRCRRCPRDASRLQPLEVAARPLVEMIRRFRPHVMVTYDESGGYPHPDHIMSHKVSVEAFDAAGDPDRYPGTGEPWQPLKLYYHMELPQARLAGAARGDARAPASSRRTPSGSRKWDDRGTRRTASRPGCRAPTTSRSATRP